MLPKVCVVTCTSGRHQCIERSVGLFINQDYEGECLQLIFNNSSIAQELSSFEIDKNKRVLLINKSKNLRGEKFTTLGQIYSEAINCIPDEFEIISMWDDDDLFLPNHISEGVKGYLRALSQGKKAYKPSKSYYRSVLGVSLVSNTLEPSIFVDSEIIKEVGFYNTTSDQHLKWVNFLKDNDLILVDDNGIPTLCYNWGDTNIPTFKTSGDPYNPKNFENYKKFSQDHGDKIITPLSKEVIESYISQIKVKPDEDD